MKSNKLFDAGLLVIFLFSCFFIPAFENSGAHPVSVYQDTIKVPVAGNTFGSLKDTHHITPEGIRNWRNADETFTTYVRVSRTGHVKVWLHASSPNGKGKISLTMDNRSEGLTIEGNEVRNYYAGEWEVPDTGYIAFHIHGISKTGEVFANIDSLELSGSAVAGPVNFVPNNEGDFYYWGRRGPSVHLNYMVPDHVRVSWFYTEITVPKGNDVIGSYFEADGFGEGYFGMQVNSPATRHILFSVWSPYNTQNPRDIPDSLKIQLVKKGKDVHAGEFGHEGSGGQSYLNYMWKPGVAYKFLLHCQPLENDHTIFTAYFYSPEERKWLLIAAFDRPETNTYLRGLYSFLENFDPQQGAIKRMALYGNQWVCTHTGKWIALNKASFTTDNTGNKGYRMDYSGGVQGDGFYLQNCGFFSRYLANGTILEKAASGHQPEIDFNTLP